MPHVVIQYTANLEAEADLGGLCRSLAAILVAQQDAGGKKIF